MGSMTQYTEQKVLNHILKTASYTPPTTVYVGLSNTLPTQAGGNWTETVYTNYARQACAFGAASARAIANSGLITFPACGATGDTVDYFGIWDNAAVGSGNLLAFGTLASSKVIVSGNTPSFAAGQIAASFNASASTGGGFTTMLDTILNWLFAGGAFAQPTNVAIDLSTSTPTDGGPNITVPSGNNYAAVDFNTWNAASAGNPTTVTNNGTIAFPSPSGSWGTITYVVVSLNSVSTPFMYAQVTSQTVGSGDTVEFLTGELELTLL